MRYAVSSESNPGETLIDLASNSYTDSFPLLRRLIFRKLEIDINRQMVPLACAVLTADHCGEQFEFSGITVGGEFAEAIRCMIGNAVNVVNADPLNRTLSTGEVDIACRRARLESGGPPLPRMPDAVPVERIDWSGDFVDRSSRNSAGFCFGACHTNAHIIADEAQVSIAVALLHARDRCRNLYVPVPSGANRAMLVRIRDALRIVSVNLELLE